MNFKEHSRGTSSQSQRSWQSQISQVWVGISIPAVLTAFGEQPRAGMILTQMWQWISECSSWGSFYKYFFFFFLSWRYAKHIFMACHYAQTIISHLLSISREPGLSHRPRQGEKHSFATVATEVLCPPSITQH